jgi:hypothetical protein
MTFLAVLFLLQPPFAQAEEKVFVVGVQDIENYLPYSEYKEGNYLGFNRKLLDMFAKSKGYRFVYKPLPLMRLYRDYILGQFDFKYPDNVYWSADIKTGVQIYYSKPVVTYTDGVLVLPEHEGRRLDQIRNLGVILGFTPAPYQKLIDSGQIKPFTSFSYQRLLRKVMLGQLDGVYSNIAVAEKYLKSNLGKPGALVFDAGLPHVQSTRHLSSIKYPELLQEFDRFLIEKKADIAKLKSEYRLRP